MRLLSLSCNKLKVTGLGPVAVNRGTGMEISPKEINPAEIAAQRGTLDFRLPLTPSHSDCSAR